MSPNLVLNDALKITFYQEISMEEISLKNRRKLMFYQEISLDRKIKLIVLHSLNIVILQMGARMEKNALFAAY